MESALKNNDLESPIPINSNDQNQDVPSPSTDPGNGGSKNKENRESTINDEKEKAPEVLSVVDDMGEIDPTSKTDIKGRCNYVIRSKRLLITYPTHLDKKNILEFCES